LLYKSKAGSGRYAKKSPPRWGSIFLHTIRGRPLCGPHIKRTENKNPLVKRKKFHSQKKTSWSPQSNEAKFSKWQTPSAKKKNSPVAIPF
jgi:hypothetical protein